MESQLGKGYALHDLDDLYNHRNRSSSRSTWYCSMLVWAAYMNATPDGNIDDPDA